MLRSPDRDLRKRLHQKRSASALSPKVTSSEQPIANIRVSLNTLKALLSKSRSKQVQAKSIIDGARSVVNSYFDTTRPELSRLGLDNEGLGGVDTLMQDLLVLSQKGSLKKSYEQTLKLISQEVNGVEVALITRASGVGESHDSQLDGKETRIASTLYLLVPSAGISYEQACLDLRDRNRKSFRGAAAELREALRESLDHLAPDKDVVAKDGFKLEKGQTTPTMKQKVRYILKSRGVNKIVSEAPENAVQIIEERVGALARSVYNRSSVSTHVGTSKEEVQQIKAYIDVVLGELLEIA